MVYFRLQDNFVKELITFYNEGNFDSSFAPYFLWKAEGKLPSKAETYKMMDSTSSLLDGMFNQPLVSKLQIFLEAIDSELTNILPLVK